MVRTFVAVELPEPVRRALDGAIGRLKEQVRRVRWVRPEGVHLTLKFLGEVPEARVPEILGAVRRAVVAFAPLRLRTTQEVGGFPRSARARVVWVGVGGDVAGLARLQEAVERGLEALGFGRENRRFSPHLTLGRARGQPVAIPAGAAAPSEAGFEVGRVVLMKSDLRPGGAVYTALGYGELEGEAEGGSVPGVRVVP